MRFFLISDNTDTQTGMRLAGIEGVVAHTAEEVTNAFELALAQPDIGMILVTERSPTISPRSSTTRRRTRRARWCWPSRTGTVRPLAVTASPAMCAKPSALRFEVQHK